MQSAQNALQGTLINAVVLKCIGKIKRICKILDKTMKLRIEH